MIALIKKFINNGLTEALDTKIDRVEVDTQSIETKVDAVDTVVDTINTNVGSNADSASATGSVHAKLKDLKANNYGVYKRIASTSASSSSTVTILNITNKSGYIIGFKIDYQNFTDYRNALRITKDGVVVYYMEVTRSGVGITVNCDKPISGIVVDSSGTPLMLVPNPTNSNDWKYVTKQIYINTSAGDESEIPTKTDGSATTVAANTAHVPFINDDMFHFKDSFKIELVRIGGASNVSYNFAIDYTTD